MKNKQPLVSYGQNNGKKEEEEERDLNQDKQCLKKEEREI